MGAVVTLDYGAMGEAGNAARNAAKKCGDYANNINKKVLQKVSSLTLGGNGNTAQIDYFARCKINELNQKKPRYENFAVKVDMAKAYAQTTDRNVSNYIRKAANDFRKSHDMKVSVITELFTWATTTILNKTAFGRWLNQAVRTVGEWLDAAKRSFKNWYELNGGKYIMKAAASIVAMIAATVFLVVVAWPALLGAIANFAFWSIVVAGASLVLAVVTVANSIVGSVNSIKAAMEFQDDPGWAKRYSSFTSLSEYLRKNNFNVPILDKLSGIAANIIDGVVLAATLISFADLVNNGIKVVDRLKDGGMAKVFNKVHFKSPSGKVTFGTIKHGIKNVIRNGGELKRLITSTSVAQLQTYYEKQSKLYGFCKKLKTGVTIVTSAASCVGKGTKENIKEIIKEKMKTLADKTVTYQYASKIEDIFKKLKELIKANEPRYGIGDWNKPAYASSTGGSGRGHSGGGRGW